MPDTRQCDRCGQGVGDGHALDPPHACPHGVGCNVRRWCRDCRALIKRYEKRRGKKDV